jgi:hypothetical protein
LRCERPIASRDDSAREISQDVPRVAGGDIGLGESGDDQLEDDGEGGEVLEDFPDLRIAAMRAQSDEVLSIENHGNEKRQAEHIVQISMREPSTDVVRFEDMTVQGIDQQRDNADWIGEILKLTLRSGH